MITQLLPAFPIGLLATLSPCVLPLYPGFLSYLAANATQLNRHHGVRVLGLVVLAGVLTMMLILGAIIAALSVSIGRVLSIVTPLANLLVIVLGVLLLLGKNPFARLPQIRTPQGNDNPYFNAFVYGLLYGPIALPCAGPLVVSLFALSFNITGLFNQLLFFLIFGLGFGVPLLLLSLLARSRQSWLLRQFTQHYAIISRVGGLLLIAVALYDIVTNFEELRLFWGI